ncbi:hypothetical protein PFISCL1PPCAC_17885, partial [Pristionchus fissidentatus]
KAGEKSCHGNLMIYLLLLTLIFPYTISSDANRYCPPSFHASDNGARCYSIANASGSSFEGQRDYCRQRGADLPSIAGANEHSSLLSFRDTTEHRRAAFYLGLECGRDNVWQWTDGSSFDPSAVKFANNNVDRVNCSRHMHSRFVLDDNGNWEEWEEERGPPTIVVCAMPTLFMAAADADGGADDDSGNDNNWVTSILIPAIVAIGLIGFILFCCWKQRAKRHRVNEMIRTLMAKTKKYEEEEKEREANI